MRRMRQDRYGSKRRRVRPNEGGLTRSAPPIQPGSRRYGHQLARRHLRRDRLSARTVVKGDSRPVGPLKLIEFHMDRIGERPAYSPTSQVSAMDSPARASKQRDHPSASPARRAVDMNVPWEQIGPAAQDRTSTGSYPGPCPLDERGVARPAVEF
jgi:hypothetical protein